MDNTTLNALTDQARAAQTARAWLDADPLFLDTETTGLSGQVVEIAVLDRAGVVLLETLVQPTVPVEAEATALHGIAAEMLRDAPSFNVVWPRLHDLIRGRTVIAYNADFDRWRLIDSARDAGFAAFAGTLEFAGPRSFVGNESADLPDGTTTMRYSRSEQRAKDVPSWRCVMRLYAEFYGDWSDQCSSYRWQKLERAAAQCGIGLSAGLHRARADAELCRQVVLAMTRGHCVARDGGNTSHG